MKEQRHLVTSERSGIEKDKCALIILLGPAWGFKGNLYGCGYEWPEAMRRAWVRLSGGKKVDMARVVSSEDEDEEVSTEGPHS